MAYHLWMLSTHLATWDGKSPCEPQGQAANLAFAELIGVQGATAIVVQHLEKAFDVLPKYSTGADTGRT